MPFLIPGVGRRPSEEDMRSYEKRTPYFYGGRFHNADGSRTKIGEQDKRSPERKPSVIMPVKKLNALPVTSEGELKVTWLGHSSVLISMSGRTILIDPVLSDIASPVSFAGVRRFSELPVKPEDIPHADIVLISHDHYDHLDRPTILKLKDKTDRFMVPLGVDAILKGWGVDPEKITALSWRDECEASGLKINATPGQHFSGRDPRHPAVAWWCGFVISDGHHTVYYSGDGGYAPHFKETGELFDIDLAIMECGQYDHGWAHSHMFPEETVQASLDVKAKKVLPVHWGAFSICNHSWYDSIERFTASANGKSYRTVTPMIGETFNYDSEELPSRKWWRGRF